MTDIDRDERSRTVGRVMAVINQLSVSPTPMSNLELAHALDVPLSSMHRLLHKLHSLGFLDCDADTARYTVAAQLSELGGRLADAGGYSQPLQVLMATIREQTGSTVSTWVPSGVHVRLSGLIVGKVRGRTSNLPGETAEPFSTPGLAVASQYTGAQIRQLIAMARRRRVPLGRKFQRISEIMRAVDQVSERGYAVGFNIRSDGWGILAWPIPITLEPLRLAALTVGAPVPDMRRQQDETIALVERLRANYLRDISAHRAATMGRDARRAT
jgi:DNA-binding IclR family transcriptional regulator